MKCRDCGHITEIGGKHYCGVSEQRVGLDDHCPIPESFIQAHGKRKKIRVSGNRKGHYTCGLGHKLYLSRRCHPHKCKHLRYDGEYVYKNSKPLTGCEEASR